MAAGHQLRTEPVAENGRTVFRGACQCTPDGGVWWYDARLPALYEKHQAHLDELQSRSRASHPSARGPR